MKNIECMRKIISSLLLVMLLCTCAAPGLCAGLFDSLLPAATSAPAAASGGASDGMAAYLQNFPRISRSNGNICVTCTLPKGVLEEAFADADGLIRATYDFESLLLLMEYSGGRSESHSFSKEYAQEKFSDELRAKITRVTFDLENTAFLVEYPEASAPVSAPAPAEEHRSLIVDDLCSVCYGLEECMHCFGEGSFYCTAGCIGGRCIACDDGKVLVGFDINEKPKYRNCSYCRYGTCKTCGGDGYVDCNACYGTGKCNACR